MYNTMGQTFWRKVPKKWLKLKNACFFYKSICQNFQLYEFDSDLLANSS